MASLKSSALIVALVAVILPLVCVEWTQAQKTIKSSFQQSVASGSAPQSVYGGYEQQRPTGQSLVAPVQQQRRTQPQPFVSRQRTESARQPVYQQEEVGSSSNYDQQAEADAEPAQYGKHGVVFQCDGRS